MSEVLPSNLKVGTVYNVKKGRQSYRVKITKNEVVDGMRDIEGKQLDKDDNEMEQYLTVSIDTDAQPGEETYNPYKFYSIEEDPSLPGGRRRRTAKKRKTRSKSRRRRV